MPRCASSPNDENASPPSRGGSRGWCAREDTWAYIRDIWNDWSPGYDAEEDVQHVREALADPEHRRTALGYYWAMTEPTRYGTPEFAAEQAAAWGGNVPQPVLYLHGTTDGCHRMTEDKVRPVPGYCGPGSAAHLLEEGGHFLMLERPHEVNRLITDWLRETSGVALAGATG